MSEQLERVNARLPPVGAVPTADAGVLSSRMRAGDYLRIIYKRRWPVLTVMVLVLGLSLLYNLTRVPIYSARAQMLIDAGTPNVVEFQGVAEPNKDQPDYYQTQYRLLQSRSLAAGTLDALDAWNAPEFTASQATTVIERVADGVFHPTATVRRWVARLRGGAAPAAAGDEAARSVVIDMFLDRLSVTPVGNSRLVDATFKAREPGFAARVVNGLADEYVQQNRDFKATASEQAIAWLKEQLQEQQKQAQSSELAAQRYREQNDPLTAEDKESIVVQKLADMTSAVTAAKTARIARESQYLQVAQLQRNPSAIEQLPFVLANPMVQDLRRQLAEAERAAAQLGGTLGDKHPEMVKAATAVEGVRAALRAETDKIVAGLYSDYQSALAEERSLSTALEAQRQEALASNRRGIDYSVLERDAASNRTIVESLMQRMKEADIAGGLESSDIRIVDRAETPRYPVAQTRGNLIMSFLMASVLAIALAFGLEYIDSTIKSPDEIRTYLRLPFLGILPVFPASAATELPLHPLRGARPFIEAFQAVRTNVLFSTNGDGAKTLLVTSTQPGEGKTVVAGNLAIALGEIGKRVLLVDGDMRRPTLHTSFRASRGPGLSEILAGAADPHAVVQTTGAENVSLLAAGRQPPSPAVLLESPRFRAFVAEVGRDYDWVVIDSPPVMAVTDATIIAAQVSGVLFVVGAEKTSRHAAGHALNQLEVARAGFVGAVLNRVTSGQHSYYYSNYYGQYGEYIDVDPSSDVSLDLARSRASQSDAR